MKRLIILISSLLLSQTSFGDHTQSLKEVLDLAYRKNPAISAAQSTMEAEESLVTTKATLEDPVIGVSTINRNARTQYGTISQKIRFPTKYILEAKAQKKRAESFKADLKMQKLLVREKVTSLYYAIYSKQKIIQLTHANSRAVREFSRVAEKKYAAGKAQQSDSMKSHFELTRLELDLIRLNQEEQSLQDNLKAVLNDSKFDNLTLAETQMITPQLDVSLISRSTANLALTLKNESPNIQREALRLREAELNSSLSKWEFAPDFHLQYQQRISGAPRDSKIYSVGVSIPLWFWSKGAKASAASSRRDAQEYRVTDAIQKLVAKVSDLLGKVKAGAKTLRIYETSLIPQALGAFNSTRSSYRANKASFLDLLDSERSLYQVRTSFFQSLKQYVNHLSQLEANIGFPVSDLARSHEVQK